MKKSSTRAKSRTTAAATGRIAIALKGVRATKDAIKRLKAKLKGARRLAKRLKKQLKAAKQTWKAASKTARQLEKEVPKATPVPGNRRARKVPARKRSASRRQRRAKASAPRTPSLKKGRRPVPSATVRKPVTPAAVPLKRKARPRQPATTDIARIPEAPQAAATQTGVEVAASVSHPQSEPATETTTPN